MQNPSKGYKRLRLDVLSQLGGNELRYSSLSFKTPELSVVQAGKSKAEVEALKIPAAYEQWGGPEYFGRSVSALYDRLSAALNPGKLKSPSHGGSA